MSSPQRGVKRARESAESNTETPHAGATPSKARKLHASSSFTAWMAQAKHLSDTHSSANSSQKGLFGSSTGSALNTWFLSGDAPSFVRVFAPGPLSAPAAKQAPQKETPEVSCGGQASGDLMDELSNDPELLQAYQQAAAEDEQAEANSPTRPPTLKSSSLKDTLHELLTGLKAERQAVSQQGSSLVAACTAVSRPPPPPAAAAQGGNAGKHGSN